MEFSIDISLKYNIKYATYYVVNHQNLNIFQKGSHRKMFGNLCSKVADRTQYSSTLYQSHGTK